MELSIGDTFKDEHLWVVLNNPHPPENRIVCVNLTSQWHDENCILHPDKFVRHPEFTHMSFIRYDRVRHGPCAAVEKAIQEGKLKRCPRLDLRAANY
jgi:hypothetical protein